ncbi:MAG: HD domain-containing protein [Holosporales bacterium]|jgi:HD superfamily phosphohydrolase|nr:HD domain-containing protein [Holosporales bacterium]
MSRLSIKKSILFVQLGLVFIGIITYVYFREARYDDCSNKLWEEKGCVYEHQIKEIIESSCIQRLKKIDQSGPSRYFGPKVPHFSRYEHSIGVLSLLKKAEVHINEQIAGLLHDASHTVFSHVGDYLFSSNLKECAQRGYQDSIHLSFLEQKVGFLLKKLNLKLGDVNPDNVKYKALEQPLPDMCADRIQYNIHTGVIMKIISLREAQAIVDNLRFNGDKWFFLDHTVARKFANLSIHFTRELWGAKWNVLMNIYFSNAIKRAIKLGIMMMDDIFSTDENVLTKLLKSDDEIIKSNLKQCNDPLNKMKGVKHPVQRFYPKCRAIDPLIKCGDGTLARLSSIDSSFKAEYDDIIKWCKQGYDLD